MRRFARLGALAATSALAVSGVVTATAPSAQALLTPNPQAGTAAASWLAGELQNGVLSTSGFPDYGESIDAGFSLQAIGNHAADVTDVADAVQAGGTSYLEYSYVDGADTFAGQSANATAKAMAFFQSLSAPRTTVGSINLQNRLESLTTASGRIEDVSTKNSVPDGQNYANTLGQAFAARALSAAGSTEAPAARTFLLGQQCASGYFRLSFTAADPTCATGDAANIDATAIAAAQLAAISGPPTAVTDAITRARTWLASVQNCDGSFGSGDDGENANTTGLAATALGSSVASQEAARWLNRHQAKSPAVAAVADAGAIALNDADYAAGSKSAIATAARGRWQRATAQAATGLASFSTQAAPLIHLSSVSGYRKAGSKVSFRVTGADEGTVVCLGTSKAFTTATGAILTGTLPAGTGSRTLTARDGYGNTAGSVVKVLGTKTLKVAKSKAKVKRNRYVTVTVSGLQPGERASIKFRNVVKASGTASSTGTFAGSFKVGAKKGKATIAGYGQFGDIRKGATKIKVVR